jgi:hypothetical protein
MKLIKIIPYTLMSFAINSHAGTDVLNTKINSLYVRGEAPKSVYIKISPKPLNCDATQYLLTNDVIWDDYTRALYSYALAANMSNSNNLQIEIDCAATPKKVIRIVST